MLHGNSEIDVANFSITISEDMGPKNQRPFHSRGTQIHRSTCGIIPFSK